MLNADTLKTSGCRSVIRVSVAVCLMRIIEEVVFAWRKGNNICSFGMNYGRSADSVGKSLKETRPTKTCLK